MTAPIDSPVLQPTSHLLVVDEFLPRTTAMAMRKYIDEHFARQFQHGPSTHQVWNYWHVPGLYTYLRTQPEKILPVHLVTMLTAAIQDWGRTNLGMDALIPPYLSMYVNGCRQGLHNDAGNGRFGWVYSLTNDHRRTQGGETLVFRLDDYGTRMHQPNAGTGLYDLVAPKFNRLVVFDDRVPHAVQPVEGSYDPVEARFVVHGHLRVSGVKFEGAMTRETALAIVTSMNEQLAPFQSGTAGRWHGPLCLRAKVENDGHISEVIRQVDRVFPIDTHREGVRAPVKRALEVLRGIQCPPMEGTAVIRLPIQFGDGFPEA